MTEKEIYDFQSILFWVIEGRFNDAQIPPYLRKILMEGIYSRYQAQAETYTRQLMAEEIAQTQQGGTMNGENQEAES